MIPVFHLGGSNEEASFLKGGKNEASSRQIMPSLDGGIGGSFGWIFFFFAYAAECSGATSFEEKCVRSGEGIDIAVGWTVSEALKRSAALAKPHTPGLTMGLGSYVHEPALLRYEGAVPLEFECPEMVAVWGKDGEVSAITVTLRTNNPSDMDKAFDMAASWKNRFANLGLEDLSANREEHVTSEQETRNFFRMFSGPSAQSVGKVLGVWRRKHEIFAVAIERWNTAPMFSPPKFIYVVNVDISKYPKE